MCNGLDDDVEAAGFVDGVAGCDYGGDAAAAVGSDEQNWPKTGSLLFDRILEGLFLQGRVCPIRSIA